MMINDRVYGLIEITEPVVLELLASPSLSRLDGIDQGGYTKPLQHPEQIFSRREHSIGVYFLLKKFGASLEEQLAGLIHDVSHSAFSHCIDYVLSAGDGKSQNHQDNIFDVFVAKTEIPAILKKYNFPVDYILDDHNFPLKETLLPDICADRLDYSLRTAVAYEEIPSSEAQAILDNLVIKDKRWVFKTLAAAKEYAGLFLKLNQKYYAGLNGAIMHQTVGDYLRRAIERGYINEADLYTTDQAVLDKVAQFHSQDTTLLNLFNRMERKIDFKNDREDYETEIQLKSRMVDPLFTSGQEIKRLSDALPEWKNIITLELQPKRYWLKAIN